MDIKDIFNKIEKIEDIKKYMSDIEDGETSYLEFKGVHHNLLDKSEKKESAKFRLTIAKEICAFANTDGGILIIGVDKREGEGLKLRNECENMESWADKNLTDLLEPRLHGFSVKSIGSDSENKPIAIYVPQSKMAPHRVRNNYPKILKGEKEIIDIPAEYFVRRGTKSEKLEENLVRAMYLSGGRAPSFRIRPDIRYYYEDYDSGRSRIEVRSIVSPDKSKFIKDYYYDMKIAFFDGFFNEIVVNESVAFEVYARQAIYPSGDEYVLDEKTCAMARKPQKPRETSTFMGIDINLPSIDEYGSTMFDQGNISYDNFTKIKYLVVDVEYACEGMQLVQEKFYYLIHQSPYFTPIAGTSFEKSKLYKNLYIDERIDESEDLEKILDIGYANEEESFAKRFGLTRRN